MARGEIFDTPITKFNDPRTGREVWKVTCWDDCHCAATYMYYQAMTADDRKLVFASNRTGVYEIYCIDLDAMKTTQLTQRATPAPREGQAEKGAIRSHLDDRAREVYLVDGLSLLAVHIDTCQSRVAASSPADHDYLKYGVTNVLTPDRKHAVCYFTTRQNRSGLALASTDGSNPHRELFTMEDPSLTIAHCTISPDSSVLAFNIVPDKQNHADVPHDLRARCWGYSFAIGRIFNLLTLPVGLRATHETWGPDNRLYFHRKTVPTWTPAAIDSVAVDGSDRQEHFVSPDRKLGHSCASPDGRWIVSDVQDTAGNELYLIDRRTKASEILCWPDSRMLDGVTGHVHPTFSPTSRRVIYTSDKTGKAAVFVVPLD